MSQFNLDNVTVYYTKSDELDHSAVKPVSFKPFFFVLFFQFFLRDLGS